MNERPGADAPSAVESDALNARHFVRVLGSLATSLILSRAISVGSLILFSAYSGPAPLAPYGLYLAIVTILWVAVFGCYEQAILVAGHRETGRLFWLSVIVAAGFVTIVFVICLFVVLSSLKLPADLSDFPLAILCMPLSLALRASNRLILTLVTREGEFASVAQTNWVQAGVQAILQIALLGLGAPYLACLILAELAGLVVGSIVLLRRSRAVVRAVVLPVPAAAELRRIASEWSMMPRWRLPMSFISIAGVSLPALTIPLAYPAALAGQLLFAMRMLEMPSYVLTGAVSPVLQRQLSQERRSRRFASLAVLLLSVVSVVGFITGGLMSLVADDWFEGTRWLQAFQAVPWLVPYFIGLTISAPLVGAVIGRSAERHAALFQFIFLAISLSAVAMLFSGFHWQYALLLFGCAMLVRAAMFVDLYMKMDARRGVDPIDLHETETNFP